MINQGAETVCGYFVSAERKKIWQVELDILQEFMRVCKKCHLKFFVAHGTLLGAVRHKGFIPWDDDIDVNMPRQDYEALKKIAPLEFRPPFFFQTFESDSNIFYGHGKLRFSNATGIDVRDIGTEAGNTGLFIDVFPMDGIVEDDKKRAEQSRHIEFYRGMLLAKIYGKRHRYFEQYPAGTWSLYKCLSRFVSADWLNRKFEEWVAKYSLIPTERSGIIAFLTDYECCYWYQADYEKLVELDFEGIKVPVPAGYERCLRIKWKDYMQFPKLNLRGIKHVGTLMSGNTPYRNFDLSHYDWRLSDVCEKEIYLFGAGKLAAEFIRFYGKKFRIVGICDNDSSRWGDAFKGYKIFPPETMKKTNVLCMITCGVHPDIVGQLKAFGHENYLVYLEGRIYR
ncbi:MAG: LicD family protein [Oscillibacter sp.]|nr:LicD family protein [Oscillibacter sp.]